MKTLGKLLGRLRNNKGQTLVEYVLVIVLLALALVVAAQTAFRGEVERAIGKIATAIENSP